MTTKKESEVSTKNTKEQILSAYQDALAKLGVKEANQHLETSKK